MRRPTPSICKTRNGPAFNAARKRRGVRTIWFDPAMVWDAAPSGKGRRQQSYSDTAIRACPTMKVLFGMALRQRRCPLRVEERCVGRRRAVADRRVRPSGVVVHDPAGDHHPGVVHREEQVLVVARVAHPSLEALGEGVLHRLAWSDLAPVDPGRLRKSEDGRRGELRSVARREEGLLRGFGRLRSSQIAQRVAITGSQVATVVLHNHTAKETGYDRQPSPRKSTCRRR